MSLILDGLRKLDRQRSYSRKGTVDLAATILKLDALPPEKKWKRYLSAISITAVVTAAVTYLAVVGLGSGSKFPSPPSEKISPLTEPSSRTAQGPQPFLKTFPLARETHPPAAGANLPAAAEPGARKKTSPPSIAAPAASRPSSGSAGSSGPLPRRTAKGDSAPSAAPHRLGGISPSQAGGPAESSPPATEPMIGKSPPPAPGSSPRQMIGEAQSGKTQDQPKSEARADSNVPAPPADENLANRAAASDKADSFPGPAKIPAGGAVSASSSSPPRVKISGIVWHDDPSKRRAVINGTFTSEGSAIEGLKVVEILPTQVRFQHQGRFFEISIFE